MLWKPRSCLPSRAPWRRNLSCAPPRSSARRARRSEGAWRGSRNDSAFACCDAPHAPWPSRTLARTSDVAVAAPAYLAAHGTPRKTRDLRAHRCLVGFTREGAPQAHWPKKGGGKFSVSGSFVSNDITLLIEAAERGLGIAVL